MKYLIIGIALFTLVSCGEEDSSATEVEAGNKDDVSTLEPEEAVIEESVVNEWVTEHPHSFIANYIEYRGQTISPEEGVEISGSVVLQEGDFYIVNITEQWGQYNYDFSLVFHGGELVSIGSPEEGFGDMYDEINQFLHANIYDNYYFLKGHFKDAPDYSVSGMKPLLLVQEGGYHTSIMREQRLYLLEGTDLYETKAAAITDAESGVCEEMDGVVQEFEKSFFPEDVAIGVEVSRNDNCENLYNIKYRYVWQDFLKVMNDDYYEPIVEAGYVNESVYADLVGLDLVRLLIAEEDTIKIEDQVRIEEVTYGGTPMNAKLSFASAYDYVGYTLIGIEKLGEEYQMFCEINDQIVVYSLQRVPNDKQLYYITLEGHEPDVYVVNGLSRFEWEEIEEEF